MALLAEYALTPDVFDLTAYTGEDVGDIQLQLLKEVLLSEGIVRDLRDGEWRCLLGGDSRPWHRRGKELLKKLVLQKRLAPFAAVVADAPASDEEWCREALASHKLRSLSGIIVTDRIAHHFETEDLVARISRLSSTPWWAGRSPSMRLRRTLADYESALELILRHANSIMFVDPYLDPSLPRYQDFITLLGLAGERVFPPFIEIHRTCYRGSGPSRQVLESSEWEEIFRRELTAVLRDRPQSVEVFIWDDFHDRYVISDLIGISAMNGFDTTRAVHNLTTWSRLGRTDRDDIQREFDPASNRHHLKARFKVPE